MAELTRALSSRCGEVSQRETGRGFAETNRTMARAEAPINDQSRMASSAATKPVSPNSIQAKTARHAAAAKKCRRKGSSSTASRAKAKDAIRRISGCCVVTAAQVQNPKTPSVSSSRNGSPVERFTTRASSNATNSSNTRRVPNPTLRIKANASATKAAPL